MMKIGNRMFDVEHDCSVMGILNVTPDSFSDGGKWNDIEKAKKHTADMIAEGASIIDIGGESTRPGHVQISIQEEIDRVVPMIEMVKREFDIPVSIDSYKGDVVEAALKAGADLVNDIWGLKYDERVAELGYPVLLATSRKSVIGTALDLPSDERVEGTIVTTVLGVQKKAAFVRVHDVKENLRAIRMTQAILREGK